MPIDTTFIWDKEVLEFIKEYESERAKKSRKPQCKQVQPHLELEIALAIMKARRRRHLSQVELAAKVGISQCALSRLESGKANPTVATLKKLANELGLNVRFVFEAVQF